MPIIIEGISDKAAGAAIHRYFIRFLESSRASLIVRYEVGKGRGAVYLNLQGVPKKCTFRIAMNWLPVININVAAGS